MAISTRRAARTGMRVYGSERPRRRGRRLRWIAVAGGIVGAVALLVGLNALMVRGHVVDGVRVGKVDVGGSDLDGAQARIARGYAAILRRPVTVRVGPRQARVSPWALGIRVDASASAREAISAARLRGSLFPFGYHQVIQPVVRLPQSFAAPPEIVGLTRPAVDATFRVGPRGATFVTPAVDGLGFPPRQALGRIAAAALAGRDSVRLELRPVHAALTTAAARRAQRVAERLISRSIVLQRAGVAPGELLPGQLARLLGATVYAHSVRVAFDPKKLAPLLSSLVASQLRPAREASWREASDGSLTVVGSQTGQAPNAALTARRMTLAARGPAAHPHAMIALRLARPTFTTREARALGVSRNVSSYTTDMGFSTPNRIYNVHLIADLLQNTVIRPGATFSFNQVVGPRTTARGFREGQAIENGLLVPSIGGGVCQVATTVFDAAFYAGFPIVSRLNHSFYISHYPLGLDATVADNGPDLVFRNDTAHAIVLHTSYTDQTLTVSVYGVPLHRSVRETTGAETNYTNPRTRYVSDPNVAAGQLSQETAGERGFDVTVTRQVLDDRGQVISQDAFASHYVPEDIIIGVGQGAKLPKGAVLEPPIVAPAT